jgi:carbamoyl-phosphate synthase small subunit
VFAVIKENGGMALKKEEKGTMLGKIIYNDQDTPFYNPYNDNLVDMVSCKEKVVYGNGAHRILLVDCGVKNNIIRNLLANDATVVRVPWDYDFLSENYDGRLISNGPGDPENCVATIQNVAKALQSNKPVMGTGLGGLIMGLASGAGTFKLKYGHPGHNQPVKQVGSESAFITAQNHGFAINADTLPENWEPCYVNLNDGSNEGFRHKSKPFFSVQFHPEPSGATPDAENMFEAFILKEKNEKQ